MILTTLRLTRLAQTCDRPKFRARRSRSFGNRHKSHERFENALRDLFVGAPEGRTAC